MPWVPGPMSERAAIPMIGISVSARVIGPNPDAEQAARAGQYRTLIESQEAAVRYLSPGEPVAPDLLDGLVLTGGGDVHPSFACYDSPPDTAKLREVDRPRDEFETELCRAAVRRGVPVLGICRGAQVLGVALGGSLLWDIDEQVEGAGRHQKRNPRSEARHWIDIAVDTRLAAILGQGRIEVNSAHHQANGTLGEGLHAAARALDGVIEAIELARAEFVIGVQWHPERLPKADHSRRLVRAFVDAASRHRLRKG